MALVALGAEAALMFVVILVAAAAGIRGDELALHRFVMAVVAINFLVPAIQLECGSRIVIEVPELPVAGGVAGFALCAEPLLVHIFLCMTPDTVYGGISKQQ